MLTRKPQLLSTLLSAPVAVQPLWSGKCSAITAESQRCWEDAEGGCSSSPTLRNFPIAQQRSTKPFSMPNNNPSLQHAGIPTSGSKNRLENTAWRSSQDTKSPTSWQSPETQAVGETNTARAWLRRAARATKGKPILCSAPWGTG